VTLVTVPHVFAPDRFGRQPAYVFTAGRHGPSGSVNSALVRTGFAAATDEPHPNAQVFLREQERARARGLGMWAPPCNGDLTLPEPAAGTVVSR
jgi:endonuclease YncB( thermonuclease family)